MIKRILCIIVAAMTIVMTCAVTSVSAAQTDITTTADKQTFMMGDIDLDGTLSVMDATTLQRGLAGMIQLSDIQLEVAKTTGGNNVFIGDATEIQRYLAGYKCNGCTGESVELEVPGENDDVMSLESIEAAVEKRFMEYINEERKAVSAQYLYTNDILMESSKVRGDELLVNFSHTRPDGSNCFTVIEDLDKFGWLGENIAYNGGYVDFSDPDTLERQIDALAYKFYDQFKNSPGHYANMINESFNCHGVGVRIVPDPLYGYECYCAHMFGQVWD